MVLDVSMLGPRVKNLILGQALTAVVILKYRGGLLLLEGHVLQESSQERSITRA
jgi:hypothetical protein